MDMSMKPNDMKVIIFHYSTNKAMLGRMLANNGDTADIELPGKNINAVFNEGDPLVIIYNADVDGHQLKGSHITSLADNSGMAKVKFDLELAASKQRFYERLPVSILVDIKDSSHRKRYSGIIKDISRNGLLLYSKEMIPVNSRIEINIIFENSIIFLEASVIRNDNNPHYNCFGLYVPEQDIISRNNLYKCLKQTCEGYTKKVMEQFNIFSSFVSFEYPNNHTENDMEQILNKSAKKLEEVLKRSKY
jgi:hypothetical protein